MDLGQKLIEWQVDEVLATYPGLAIQADGDGAVVLAGQMCFSAATAQGQVISDSYDVSIAVPLTFPRTAPRVRERSGRVDRTFHTNPDGSLCLGSPVRLHIALARGSSLRVFIDRCVVPFLYGYSYREQHGYLPYGELRHGEPGLLDDLCDVLGLSTPETCIELLRLAGLKKRLANKQLCPCGSGRRLGRCHNRVSNRARALLGRCFCRSQAAVLKSRG